MLQSFKSPPLPLACRSLNGKRAILPAVAGVLLLASVTAPALAQANKGPDRRNEEQKVIASKDGMPIAFTYFKAPNAGEDTPVLIMLHRVQKNANRLVWVEFARALQRLGYSSVAVDLRKHGESRRDGDVGPAVSAGKNSRGRRGAGDSDLKLQDYRAIIGADLEALKAFLLAEHQAKNLNIRKTAILAEQQAAPLAITFAAVDWMKPPYDDSSVASYRTPRGQDIRALVLLSPDEKVTGIVANPAIARLKNPAWGVAVFIAAGEEDGEYKEQAEDIYQKFTAAPKNEERMELHVYPRVKFRGTDMLRLGQRIPLQVQIAKFLQAHVKELPDKWRDRRSRLTK